MTSVKTLALIALAAAAFALPAPAWADRHATVSLNAGTPGLGGSVGLMLGKTVGVRLEDQSLNAVGSSFSSFANNVSADNNAYATQLTVHAFSALVDVHPGGGAFMITAGAMQPNISLAAALEISGTGEVFLGGNPVQVGVGGTVTGSLKWNQTAPYFGIGYLPLKSHGGLALGLEAGAAFIGPPQATLMPSGSFSVNGVTLQRDIQEEQSDLDRSTHGLDYYPVATVSLSYTF